MEAWSFGAGLWDGSVVKNLAIFHQVRPPKGQESIEARAFSLRQQESREYPPECGDSVQKQEVPRVFAWGVEV